MSALTHCDNKSCENSFDTTQPRRSFQNVWLTVSNGVREFDYCSRDCLVAHWSATSGSPVPGAVIRRLCDPTIGGVTA